MLDVISKHVHGHHAQEKIVSLLLKLGLHIGQDGFYYCGPVRLNESLMAYSMGLDRRSLRRFSKKVLGNAELKNIFCNIKASGYSSEKFAREQGNGLIKVWAFARKPGIIFHVSRILAQNNIVILQMIADNPETTRNPKLVIITEGRVQREIKNKLEKIPNIKKVRVW